VTGRIGLHGGAEFLVGDEAFLAALLGAALERHPRDADTPVEVVILPVAAAGQNPDAAAGTGIRAFERVAAAEKIAIETQVARVVDAATADDEAMATCLRKADIVYLPGGDPGIVPAILAGTRAWRAVLDAHADGAVVAGASAGAMGLAPVTWGPSGIRPGLGLVPGLVVIPHFASFDPQRWRPELTRAADLGLAILGLDERTGVLSDGARDAWRVVGEGRAWWSHPRSSDPIVARSGETIDLRVDA
jgi:cyanophycinase-like exopeptidase